MIAFRRQANCANRISTILSGLLISLPIISIPAIAMPVAQIPDQQNAPTDTVVIPSTGATVKLSELKVAGIPPVPQNPCPSIYYENPHNQMVVVPEVCRPNLITQQLEEVGLLQEIRARGSTAVTAPVEDTGTPGVVSPTAP
ncbi:hypothetical protein K9N68_36055 (plasmid) [Kovacikia minuta CCNUW1]|uniref:hypothetical protein n=1 Tax=Kovacikia minuta TaxID=2931930 RepID=UPI001CCE806D|nr:hypothetical protein [Kovacikia minuta]UBF30591.1 hypothetical protein K9N68_36055 [Kovacikia minuta CCNUW1]